MGCAEEKKTQKRLSLMDAAFRLFTTQGIGRTSIEDIAKAAGVAKGTFYLYFKDKNDLHQVLVQKSRSSCSGMRWIIRAIGISPQRREKPSLLMQTEFWNKSMR